MLCLRGRKDQEIRRRCRSATSEQRLAQLQHVAAREAHLLATETPNDAIHQMERVQENAQLEQLRQQQQITTSTLRHRCFMRFGFPTTVSTPFSLTHVPLHWWGICVKMLLVCNALCVALFYELNVGFGWTAAVLVPLPMLLNVLLQSELLWQFVLLASICSLDVETLSNVVDHFTEMLQLRCEFIASVHAALDERNLTVREFGDRLATHVDDATTLIHVEQLRQVLTSVGFNATFYKFNCVARLIFNKLHDSRVDVRHVVQLLSAGDEYRHSDVVAFPRATMPAHEVPSLRRSNAHPHCWRNCSL